MENEVKTPLSQADLDRAATNDPATSPTFKLGDREFKVLDLNYKDYIRFFSHLKPMIGVIVGAIATSRGVPMSLPAFDSMSLIDYCAEELPEMVRIICSQTDPTITAEEVTTLGKTPFTLARIVAMQMNRNNMINDFMDFLKETLPLLKAAMGLLGKKPTQPQQ